MVRNDRHPRSHLGDIGKQPQTVSNVEGWPQGELARRVRERGFGWYRYSVEAAETGQKQVDLAELLPLLDATRCGIPDLLQGEEDTEVREGVGFELRAARPSKSLTWTFHVAVPSWRCMNTTLALVEWSPILLTPPNTLLPCYTQK